MKSKTVRVDGGPTGPGCFAVEMLPLKNDKNTPLLDVCLIA
jgi:hypothetical protein